MKPSENFPRTKMHKCNCSYDSHLINIVYWSQSSLELKTGFVRSLEILGKPGFLVLKNPWKPCMQFQIYSRKTLKNWETEQGIGSYLNHVTLFKKNDWINLFCTVPNMVATFLRVIEMSFKLIYGILHSKTCQLHREFFLYILNTLKKSWKNAKKSWKTLDFLNYESVRTLLKSYVERVIRRGCLLSN